LHIGSHLDQVLAVVATLREGGILALRLEPARLEGLGEPVDLDPRVVHVEFAGDLVAGPVEEARDRIPQSRATAVRNVEGAGGVRGDELDQPPAPGSGGRTTVPTIRFYNVRHLRLKDGVAEAEVDEPWPGDLRARRASCLQVELVDDHLGDLARRAAEPL